MKKTEFIGLRVTKELLEQVDSMARQEKRTRSNMVLCLLERAVENAIQTS